MMATLVPINSRIKSTSELKRANQCCAMSLSFMLTQLSNPHLSKYTVIRSSIQTTFILINRTPSVRDKKEKALFGVIFYTFTAATSHLEFTATFQRTGLLFFKSHHLIHQFFVLLLDNMVM